MGINVDFVDKLIYITSPHAELLDVQNLINEVRYSEASTSGMAWFKVANATGKDQLSSGVLTGITMSMHEPWQLKYAQGNYQAYMTNGNLVRASGLSPVITYTAGVQNILLQSASATIVTAGGGGGSSPSAIEIATQVDSTLSTSHGSGSWEGVAGSGASPSDIANAVWNADMSLHTASGTAGAFMNFMYGMEGGRWKIDTTLNQMVFYKSDNTTEIARFNLYDKGGSAANDDVYERKRT